MSFHAIESCDCIPCEVCVGCHERHDPPAAEVRSTDTTNHESEG